jgi:hypothetical protein
MFLGLKWILMQTAMQLLGGTHAESTPLLLSLAARTSAER